MNIKKIRDLDISKEKFDFANSIKDIVSYKDWIKYIDNNDSFIWYEDTSEGKEIISNLDAIPTDFRDCYISILNKVRAYFNYDERKNKYNGSIGYSEDSKKISISFDTSPTVEDLKKFLDMAKYLDALLLKDGSEIIDEKVIEELERKL